MRTRTVLMSGRRQPDDHGAERARAEPELRRAAACSRAASPIWRNQGESASKASRLTDADRFCKARGMSASSWGLPLRELSSQRL